MDCSEKEVETEYFVGEKYDSVTRMGIELGPAASQGLSLLVSGILRRRLVGLAKRDFLFLGGDRTSVSLIGGNLGPG